MRNYLTSALPHYHTYGLFSRDLWGRLSPPVHRPLGSFVPTCPQTTPEVISKQKTFSGKALNPEKVYGKKWKTMSRQRLNIIYAFLFALAKADFLNDGRKRFSDDLDHLAGNQRREDRALSDADSGIPEGDQVQADDCQDYAEQNDRAVHNGLDIQVQKYAERYEDNTDALHAQTSDISSGKEEVSDHPLREVDKISKDRREDDLSQVDRVEFFAEKYDLHKDVKAKYYSHAGSGLHFYNVTDDIRKRIDRGDTQVGIGRKRHSQCHKEQRYTIEQYSDPPLGKCAFSHVVLHVRIIDRERAPQRALPLKDEE